MVHVAYRDHDRIWFRHVMVDSVLQVKNTLHLQVVIKLLFVCASLTKTYHCPLSGVVEPTRLEPIALGTQCVDAHSAC